MIWLLFAHFIGDFGLQKEWIALNKGKYPYLMFAHSMIWTGCICVALAWMEIGVRNWEILFLLLGHFVCDSWKCRATKDFPTWHFYADQVFHVFQLLVVWYS